MLSPERCTPPALTKPNGVPIAGRAKFIKRPVGQTSQMPDYKLWKHASMRITEMQAKAIYARFQHKPAWYFRYTVPNSPLGQNCSSATLRLLNKAGIGNCGLANGPYSPTGIAKATAGSGLKASMLRATPPAALSVLHDRPGLLGRKVPRGSWGVTRGGRARRALLFGTAAARNVTEIGIKLTLERVQ